MPARLFSIPFFVWLLAALYVAWKNDGIQPLVIAPPLVALAVLFVMSPQINWWWWSRNPPDLPDGLRAMLEKCAPFYQKMPESVQKRFRTRLFLIMEATEFMPKGWPDDRFPEDIKAMIAAQHARLTLDRADFLLPKFETVVVYRQAFPSPNHQFFHGSELFEEDGCLIFSAEHVIKGFMEEGQYFQVALYEYARAFQKSHPEAGWPVFSETDWPLLETAGQVSKPQIENAIGLPDPNPLAVAVHHFFQKTESFAAVFPEESVALQRIFSS